MVSEPDVAIVFTPEVWVEGLGDRGLLSVVCVVGWVVCCWGYSRRLCDVSPRPTSIANAHPRNLAIKSTTAIQGGLSAFSYEPIFVDARPKESASKLK